MRKETLGVRRQARFRGEPCADAWINEGVRSYDEGVADKEDIDRGMTLGTNVPMGPLTLADHIGLDICLDASQTLHEELGDRYKPAYLLKRKVDAGDL
ncbi:hypothetical protein C8039_03995 [Halogeometricum sp. wsp3]|nr:hypothetical protein C8039_03995 [Halogeometricum sp. wsp3]